MAPLLPGGTIIILPCVDNIVTSLTLQQPDYKAVIKLEQGCGTVGTRL